MAWPVHRWVLSECLFFKLVWVHLDALLICILFLSENGRTNAEIKTGIQAVHGKDPILDRILIDLKTQFL